jgi:exodeoxyribonuclease VII large subunit
VTRYRRELALLRSRPVLCRPRSLLSDRRQHLDDLREAQRRALAAWLRDASRRLQRLREKLAALGPQAVLARGYSIARLPDGTVVRSFKQVESGAIAEVVFAEGSADVVVRKTVPPIGREDRA